MQRSSDPGMLPFVFKLIVPLDRRSRIVSIARAMAVERSSGSPSQPWPNDTMPSSTRSRCSIATRARSPAAISSAIRACGDGTPASGSCSEMQPMQRALQRGETGSAASPRSRKTFCAVKQPYSREHSATCRSTRLCGSRAIRRSMTPSSSPAPNVRGDQSSPSSVRIAATKSRSSTSHANVYPKSGSAGASRSAAYAGSSSRV